MAEFITLAEVNKTSPASLDQTVVDEVVRSNYVLANIPFHQAASVTGGGSLTYTFNRLTTQADAVSRAFNADYAGTTVGKTAVTVACRPFGNMFKVDRVLGKLGMGQEIALNFSQIAKEITAKFNDSVINGSIVGDANGFDGLSVQLTGTDNELDGSALDWTAATVNTTAEALAALDSLDELLASVNGTDGLALVVSQKAALRIQSIARMAGYLTQTESAAGAKVQSYQGVPIVTLGAKNGSSTGVITETAGVSDIYAVRFAPDGFHAVSPAGQSVITTYVPNLDTATSPVVECSVEMVAAVALRSLKAAAVLRDVQVGPAA